MARPCDRPPAPAPEAALAPPIGEVACTANAIAWHAHRTPDATAVVEAGHQRSYRQLAADIANCARLLESRGVRPGMLVGVEVGLRRTWNLLLFLACEVIGAPATAFTRPDLERDDPVLPGCDRLLFTSPPFPVGWSAPRAVLVPAEDDEAVASRPASADDLRRLEWRPDPARLVRIARTSGSTGRPKAVPVTNAIQQRILIQRLQYLPAGIRAAPRFLCLYALGIRAVYTRAYATLTAGGIVVFALEPQASSLLESGAVNWLMLLVGDMDRVVRRSAPPPADFPLLLEMIGARASRALRQLARDRLGATVHTNYSSNETNTIAYTDDDNTGTLCPGVEARIVDQSGRELPLGETGLVQVRTNTMVDGYCNDPDLTARMFVDGWYHTNDAGYIPEAGRLVVLGRADDMLNVGGVKLPPAPIEEEIKAFDGVRDAVLLALETDDRPSTLTVAVEVDPSAPPPDLHKRVETVLARYVRSFHLMPLPSFPRTDTGKVRRGEIEAAVRRRFG